MLLILLLATGLASCGGRTLEVDGGATGDDAATSGDDGGGRDGGGDEDAGRLLCVDGRVCPPERRYCCGVYGLAGGICETIPDPTPDCLDCYCLEMPALDEAEPNDCVGLDGVYHWERCPADRPYCCLYYLPQESNPDLMPSCVDHPLYGSECVGPDDPPRR